VTDKKPDRTTNNAIHTSKELRATRHEPPAGQLPTQPLCKRLRFLGSTITERFQGPGTELIVSSD